MNEKKKQLSRELVSYVAFRIEFEKILLTLMELLKKQKELIENKSEREIQEYYFSSLDLDFYNWDRWERKWDITDNVLLEELLKFQESYQETLRVFKEDIGSLYLKIEEEQRKAEPNENTIKMYEREIEFIERR